MKKTLLIFVVLTFLIILIGIYYKPQIVEDKPDAYNVMEYENNSLLDNPTISKDYYLLFDNYKLDTKNFVEVLSNLIKFDARIIAVYPYINPMYQSLLKEINKINYTTFSLDKGITKMYETYMSELEGHGLTDEIDKVLVNGIRIRMIKANVNNEVLYNFLRNHIGVKYSLSATGLFKEI